MKPIPVYPETIRRIHVEFSLTRSDLDPDEVSLALKMKPTRSARRGDERRNPRGTLLSPHKEGWWELSTEGKVESKEINQHLEYLLTRLLPHRETILSFANGGETFFDVLWETAYFHGGNGPILTTQSIKGMAELNAGIGFDIYRVDED